MKRKNLIKSMLVRTTMMLMLVLFTGNAAWAQESTFNLKDYVPHPEELAGGTIVTIFPNIAGLDDSAFPNMEMPVNYAYQATVNGVTVDATLMGGYGIQDNEDQTQSLVLWVEVNKASKLTFGEVAWTGDGIAFDHTQTLANVEFDETITVDLDNLTFSKTGIYSPGETMTLVNYSGEDKEHEVAMTVDYGTGKTNHSQAFTHTFANGVAVSATLTGTASFNGNALTYAVEGTGVNSINLANWDGTKESANLSGWTLAEGATILTDGMSNLPELAAGNETVVLNGGQDGYLTHATISGANTYAPAAFSETDETQVVTIAGTQGKGITCNTAQSQLVYRVGTKDVTSITIAPVAWNPDATPFDCSSAAYNFAAVTTIGANDFAISYENPEAVAVNQAMTLLKANATLPETTVTVDYGTGKTNHSQAFTHTFANGVAVTATLTGKASFKEGVLTYAVEGISVNSVNLANWDYTKGSANLNDWTLAEGATILTDGMSNLPKLTAGNETVVLNGGQDGYFTKATISGANTYASTDFSEADEALVVTIAGTQDKGITCNTDQSQLVYRVGTKDVTNIIINSVAWNKGTTILDCSSKVYDYSRVTEIDTNGIAISYDKPKAVSAGDAMTLLNANATLKDISATETKDVSYQYAPVSGVIMDATIIASMGAKNGAIDMSINSNKADKLIFGDVDWKDNGALIEHKTMLTNVSFDGADVETSKINFTNKEKLDANQKMILVSDFGTAVGTITGSKYKVGTAYEGEGSPYFESGNLFFVATSGAGQSDETHTTVMAMEAGVALLAAGNEHVAAVAEGLGLDASKGISPDGVSTFATMGGGASRYETGSAMLRDYDNQRCIMAFFDHIYTGNNSWNMISVPFDVDLSSDLTTLKGGEARPLLSAVVEGPQGGNASRTRSADTEGSTLRLTFDAPVTTLKAGVPYIIKWNRDDDIVNPLFIDVLIEMVHNDYDNGLKGDKRVRFIGLYDPYVINGVNQNVLYMGSDNRLYSPDGQNKTTINSFQAYIKVGEDNADPSVRLFSNYIISFADDIPEGIKDITRETVDMKSQDSGWYAIDGRKLSGKPTASGMYIHNGKKHVVR